MKRNALSFDSTDFLGQSALLAGGIRSQRCGGCELSPRRRQGAARSRSRWPNGRCTRRSSARNSTTSTSPRRQAGLRHRRHRMVNQFFKDKAKDQTYLAELKKRADDQGVKSLLIMCDGEGDLGDPDDAKRTQGRREPLQVGRSRQVPRLPLDPRQRRRRRRSAVRGTAEARRRRPAPPLRIRATSTAST